MAGAGVVRAPSADGRVRGARVADGGDGRERKGSAMIPRTYGHVGTPIEFKGNAYDFGHRIAAIEFSLDEGAHWTRYDTDGTNDYQNLTWTFTWTPEKPGAYVLRVRSVNDEGKASPESAYAEIQID